MRAGEGTLTHVLSHRPHICHPAFHPHLSRRRLLLLAKESGKQQTVLSSSEATMISRVGHCRDRTQSSGVSAPTAHEGGGGGRSQEGSEYADRGKACGA